MANFHVKLTVRGRPSRITTCRLKHGTMELRNYVQPEGVIYISEGCNRKKKPFSNSGDRISLPKT